jgi:hypothetical protein
VAPHEQGCGAVSLCQPSFSSPVIEQYGRDALGWSSRGAVRLAALVAVEREGGWPLVAGISVPPGAAGPGGMRLGRHGCLAGIRASGGGRDARTPGGAEPLSAA